MGCFFLSLRKYEKSTLLLTLASIALPTYAQTSPAPVQERDPLQNEASMPNINQQKSKRRLAEKNSVCLSKMRWRKKIKLMVIVLPDLQESN